MGLDVYLKVKSGKKYRENDVTVELPSKVDPEHLFKVGYLRSSYNPAGINTVLKNLGVSDLYEIFEPGDRYEFTPDWTAARERALKAVGLYEKRLAETGNVRVLKAGANPFTPVHELCPSESEALNRYVAELKKKPSGLGSYSNKDGHFYHQEPLRVRALIEGSDGDGFMNKLTGAPPQLCTYVIFEVEADGKPDWYLTALKIVVETIDYVLKQPDAKNHYLTWSS